MGAKGKKKGIQNKGVWSEKEHVDFLAALRAYGKNWQDISEYVQTRTSTQARTHAQKFLKKHQKDMMNMKQFNEGRYIGWSDTLDDILTINDYREVSILLLDRCPPGP